jgi:DNA-binding response OmpR family regulator
VVKLLTMPFSNGQSKSDFLVIDDSESVRVLLARMLKVLGFDDVDQACSAMEALKIFSDKMVASRAPIILLDINLPDLSGDIVARKILGLNPNSKIILVTAEDRTEELTMDVIRQGAYGYIQKPIRLSVLRDVLEGIA